MGHNTSAHKTVLLLSALILAGACSRHVEPAENPLLGDLMSRIDSVDIYIARYEDKLAKARSELQTLPPDSEELVDAYISMGQAYAKFISDSSLAYYERVLKLAAKLGLDDKRDEALLRKAATLIHTGFFFEGARILNSISPESLNENNHIRYYESYASLYHDAYQILGSKPAIRSEFVAIYENYRDTLLTLLPEDSSSSIRLRERKCARAGDFEAALALNRKRMDRLDGSDKQKEASILYDLFIIYTYYMNRPIEDYIDYVLQSAIIDLECANQNIASLRYVERYLTNNGMVAEAKKVSDYYYSTILKLGSRFRLLGEVESTVRINERYAAHIEQQKHRIQVSLLIIVLMALVLLMIVVVIIRSRNRMAQLNQQLERSGKTANRYVLGFFELYSSYISRLMALRAKINTNTRKGNTKYVLDLTDPSKDITNEELKQMYNNFDSAFLDIFPNYVRDFNAMLKPDCKITLKPGELLNTELRIFAVIKLGITDSSKISELLHCSIKTIYNKRSELNSKLLVPKEEFAKKLAEI